jgi:hypothetical protein
MNRNRDWKVTRYSKDGKKLQDIQRDDSRRALYRSIPYLTENNNGDICVSDNSASQVVVGTRSGQYRFSYSGDLSMKGFCPYGICTDILGHIIVSFDFFELASTIYLLSEDGQLLKSLDQYQPAIRAVCVDNRHNLWLGQGSSNVVSVCRYFKT